MCYTYHRGFEMKKEIRHDLYCGASVSEGTNRTPRGEWNTPSEVPEFIQGREVLIRDLKPEFTVPVDLKDMEPPSLDMFESLTQAVKMIKKCA